MAHCRSGAWILDQFGSARRKRRYPRLLYSLSSSVDRCCGLIILVIWRNRQVDRVARLERRPRMSESVYRPTYSLRFLQAIHQLRRPTSDRERVDTETDLHLTATVWDWRINFALFYLWQSERSCCQIWERPRGYVLSDMVEFADIRNPWSMVEHQIHISFMVTYVKDRYVFLLCSFYNEKYKGATWINKSPPWEPPSD